jgi:CubicO group peptidase (beta-lactamase class C family)
MITAKASLRMARQTSVVLAGAFAALSAMPAAQPAAPAPEPQTTLAMPPSLGDGWATGAPAQLGIDRRRLEQMTASIRSHPEHNVHAVLIERDGRLVYEEYFSGKDERRGRALGVITFTRDTLHDLRSVTKSVISALVGVASASGAIPSLDAPLLDYFPEYKDLQEPERRGITIRHALGMTAGLDWNEDLPYTDPKNDEIVMDRSPDPARYVLSRPIVAAPGAIFRYNGGMTEVLGAILQRATKQPLIDYARTVLFSPLGITEFEWIGSGKLPSAASGLRLRPRDLAKFGSLYLHDGQWRGRQILPRTWVHESTQRRFTFPGQEARGYAYQWWHTCYSTPSGSVEAPTAVGNGMQRIFVLRAQRTVVTVVSGRYNDRSINPPERLLLDFILPALPQAPASTCPS